MRVCFAELAQALKRIRSGHPIKDARIGSPGAPYRTKLGTTGRRRFLSDFSDEHPA